MATTAIPANNADGFKRFNERAKLWAARLLRLVQAALVVAVAYAFGRFFGARYGAILPPAANVQLVQLSFFSAAGLSTIKELLTVFPKVWEYVRTGKGQNLYDFSSFVFLTSLTLAVAAWGITKGNGSPVATPSQQGVNTNPIIFLQPSGRNTKFLVPFSENAEGCEANTDKFRQGKTWVIGTERFIDQLTQGLLHCSIPGKPVKIDIRGFASSADFQSSKGVKCINSDELNVGIANLRAQTVHDEMVRVLGASAGAVSITPRFWGKSEFESMRSEAVFNDQKDGKPEKERGDLTRRADIIVTDAGDCEPR